MSSTNKCLTLMAVVVSILSTNFCLTEACLEKLSDVDIVCLELFDDAVFTSVGKVFQCRNAHANEELVSIPNAEVTAITHFNGSDVESADQIEILCLHFIKVNFISNNIKKKLPKL